MRRRSNSSLKGWQQLWVLQCLRWSNTSKLGTIWCPSAEENIEKTPKQKNLQGDVTAPQQSAVDNKRFFIAPKKSWHWCLSIEFINKQCWQWGKNLFAAQETTSGRRTIQGISLLHAACASCCVMNTAWRYVNSQRIICVSNVLTSNCD
jgi:hypothetical protein